MRFFPARLRVAALLVGFVVPALGGMAHAQASAAPRPPLVAAPATPQQASSNKLAVVQQAFNLLYGGFVYPISSAQWLSDAWDGVNTALTTAGGQPVATPTFDGNPDDDWAAFSRAFKSVAATGVASQTEMAYGAIGQMVSARNSCHTYFLPPARAASFNGSEVHQQTTDTGMVFGRDDLIVYRVYPGGPADVAGVHEGDTIIATNGQGGDAKAIRGRIVNAGSGQTVQLTVQRPGVDTPLTLSLTPETTVLPFIRTSIVGGDIGVIEFDDFTDGPGLVDAIRQAIDQFNQQGVTGWVLDLRTNSGGGANTMAAIASLFMSKGRIATDFDRAGTAMPIDVDPTETMAVQKPLVVLTEKNSASAAEFLPGALQDDGRAYVIGANSFGCVSSLLGQTLSDGSFLAVQVFQSVVGNDNLNINGVGVTPNQIIVRTPAILASGDDPQMDAAVQYLHSQSGG